MICLFLVLSLPRCHPKLSHRSTFSVRIHFILSIMYITAYLIWHKLFLILCHVLLFCPPYIVLLSISDLSICYTRTRRMWLRFGYCHDCMTWIWINHLWITCYILILFITFIFDCWALHLTFNISNLYCSCILQIIQFMVTLNRRIFFSASSLYSFIQEIFRSIFRGSKGSYSPLVFSPFPWILPFSSRNNSVDRPGRWRTTVDKQQDGWCHGTVLLFVYICTYSEMDWKNQMPLITFISEFIRLFRALGLSLMAPWYTLDILISSSWFKGETDGDLGWSYRKTDKMEEWIIPRFESRKCSRTESQG